jgi:hypothetical protein
VLSVVPFESIWSILRLLGDQIWTWRLFLRRCIKANWDLKNKIYTFDRGGNICLHYGAGLFTLQLLYSYIAAALRLHCGCILELQMQFWSIDPSLSTSLSTFKLAEIFQYAVEDFQTISKLCIQLKKKWFYFRLFQNSLNFNI